MVLTDVEQNFSSIVMIYSIAVYRLTVRVDHLYEHLHALSNYRHNVGVTVLLINDVEHIAGDFKATETGISYLADNMIFMRYLAINGELRRVIGILKKRLSDF